MKTSVETNFIISIAATGCLVLACALLGAGCAAQPRLIDYNTASRNSACVDPKVADSCTGMRLAAANLSGSDLEKKRFVAADLRFTVLNRVNARSADFTNANLSRSKLVKADLRQANLQNANLSNADLRDADLRGAKLTGAILDGADIRGAIFDSHAGIDLSRVVKSEADRAETEWSIYGVKTQKETGIAL